jgi:hypothetical protein
MLAIGCRLLASSSFVRRPTGTAITNGRSISEDAMDHSHERQEPPKTSWSTELVVVERPPIRDRGFAALTIIGALAAAALVVALLLYPHERSAPALRTGLADQPSDAGK